VHPFLMSASGRGRIAPDRLVPGSLRPPTDVFRAARVLMRLCGIALLAGLACAQVEPPSGGPEDKTLPRVAGMHPDSGAVGVASLDTVSFLFSKPMDRASVRDWIFLSPPLAIREEIWPVPGRLDLVLDQRPDSGKTYQILLGAEVKDRRKNALGPWIASFSTGPTLDTGAAEGKVMGQRLRPANAYLYVWPWSDSSATELAETPPPLRMGQADAGGAFRLGALPRNEPLRVCALYDAGRDRVYDSEDDVWGCLDRPLVLSDTSGVRSGLEIYLVLADEPGILKGAAVDSSCVGVGAVVLTRLGREADSLNTLIGMGPPPKERGLADSLLGFNPPPPTAEETAVDSLAVRSHLSQVDSLRVLARADSARCALPVIVRLFERDTSLVAESRGTGAFEFRDVPPGTYRLRGFRDRNGNGIADPGEPTGAVPDSIIVLPGRTVDRLDFPLLPSP
jgi:hypothetical protein